jgi:hypothetical protein
MPRPFRTRPLAAAATAATIAALLAACTDDPFDRPGTVAPRGLNEANLRAMVVDPAHLRLGVDAPGSRGDAGSRPVDLLRSGKRAPLTAGGASAMAGMDAGAGGAGNGGR